MRVIKRILPLIAVIAIVASSLIFFGVTLSRDDGLNISEPNLASSATISGSAGCGAAFDNSRVTGWNIPCGGKEAIVHFGETESVNALVLNEVGFNITKFSIYFHIDGEWELCYRQNEIGVNRLATFYTVVTDKIKITVDEVKASAIISDIRVYNLLPRERDNQFRVTSYVKPAAIKEGRIDSAWLDTVTHVQLFPYAYFDVDGGLVNEEDEALSMLREMIGGRDVKIFLGILAPESGATMAEVYERHMDASVDSVADCVLATGADGADFDWEYPSGKKQWRLYGDYIIKLHAKLAPHGKQVTVALSPWGVDLEDEAIKCIDQLQLMSYDLFDHNGDNNSYAGGVETSVAYFLKLGFKREQINLGISYYGRPRDGSFKWYDYKDPRFTPDEYIMYQDGVWFNTPTTVRDKTVYSILKGLGGVMIFAQDEDLPMDDKLSLTRSISQAKSAFCKEVLK